MKLNRSALGRFALTHVAVAAIALAGTSAHGLGLGRLNVQSALGETLKAEIDISAISAEEAGTLKVRVAPPEAYRATGVEYNTVLTSTEIELMRRGDGKPYLRLKSDRAVQEPFVDVILELTWSGGRLVREYTLLFDPPSLSRPAPPATVSAAAVMDAPTPASRAIAAAPRASRPATTAAPAAAAAPTAPAPRPAAATPAPAPSGRAAAAASAGAAPAGDYQVRAGDSLSRIASRTKPEGISLDQMLVGLFRGNPDAFMGENMNRLKSGVVLQLPSNEALQSVSAGEAREIVTLQSADFAAYRQRLASGAPELQPSAAARQATGKVQTELEDRKPATAAAPDKLTLSKAAGAAKEAQLSEEARRKAEAERVAELQRNVAELKTISAASKPAPTTAVAAASAAPVPAVAPASPGASAAAPAIASAPTLPAPKAAASAPTAKPAAPPRTMAEPGLLDQLMGNPLVLPIAGVLVALLGGFGLMRLKARNAKPKADTTFHESRLQPDSFFGASGGQRVDTRDASTSASSMSYSLSQLDAIGDVDPVAEADVYLAYGRDLQAEEILKEALRATPERLAIRIKLLEVYAKRRDIKGFEQLAVHLYAETQGTGDDWAKAQELGRQIDPDNPLYQPGGAPSQLLIDEEGRPEPMNASTLPAAAQHSALVGAHLATNPLGQAAAVAPLTAPGGLDLDLDLDLGSTAAASPSAMEATQALATSVEQAPLAMDFDLSEPSANPVAAPAAAAAAPAELSFDLGDLGDVDTAQGTESAALPTASAGGSLDFDLGSINLDLPPATDEPIPAASASAVDAAEFDSLLEEEKQADPLAGAFDTLGDEDGDPLQRQLELADEFRQIGDTEGARDVLQELIGKASGPVRQKAEAMLAELR